VFLTVPFSAQQQMLQAFAGALAGKVVVCTSVPIHFTNTGIELLLVHEGGSSLQAKADLPLALVVGAFQNIGAADLWKIDQPLNADVIVASDCEGAKRKIMALCSLVPGLGAVDGGDLGSTPYVEALTVLLLRINKNYPDKHATVKITGIVS
jgi:NADPH-dependent F420 reductase